ncbi:Uncharacterised protein [Chryseobacterium nakagawai]|nr:hypothetical protein [Chryseobacterium nakagawai]VEH18784.1 Uncharacterised protein [Chryseobacterium nakagawai]
MKNIKFSYTGKYTFIISFLSGTFLLILMLITRWDFLLMLGFIYVIAAIIVNVIIFLLELIDYLTEVSEKNAFRNSMFLLMANIPIAFIYLLIVINFC